MAAMRGSSWRGRGQFRDEISEAVGWPGRRSPSTEKGRDGGKTHSSSQRQVSSETHARGADETCAGRQAQEIVDGLV